MSEPIVGEWYVISHDDGEEVARYVCKGWFSTVTFHGGEETFKVENVKVVRKLEWRAE